MSDLPFVTCITPTYGRFDYLCEMVWCWTTQTYPRKELIIVNDQNNLILTTSFPGIKIFNFEERFVGLGEKRNFAIAQANPESEYICPWDDDDLFFPEHIDFLVKIFGEDKAVERVKNLKHFVSIDNNWFNISHDTNQTYFGASLFRKQVFIDFPLKDYLIMGEDADLFERKKLNMKLEQNPLISSFVHRRGMGIPHASALINMTYDRGMQDQIAKEFIIKSNQFNVPTELEIVPKLTFGKSIYEKIDNYRKDPNNRPK